MAKHGIVIKFDINGFAEKSKSVAPKELARFLSDFYQMVLAECTQRHWRFVKSMGDCVLVLAEDNYSAREISKAHETINKRFGISTSYRDCEFEEINFSIDNYSCLDMVGNDINNLFLEDKHTVTV